MKGIGLLMNPSTSIARPGGIDPSTIVRIRDLQVRARWIVDGFMAGLHRSPLHGFSSEFSEYRPYTHGDDLRNLDWKLYGRSDRYFIKRFEDETNLRCILVADRSRSMDYGSIGYSKWEYARTLIATLGYFLMKQRDAVGLMVFEDIVREYIPPRFRPGHLSRLMSALEQPAEGKATDLQAPISQLADLANKRGWIVIVSDFLVPLEGMKEKLSMLRARRHEVMAIRILDPAELEFPFEQPVMIEDAESQREVFVDPPKAKAGYLKNFKKHSQALENLLAQLGIDSTTVLTREDLDSALYRFLAKHAL